MEPSSTSLLLSGLADKYQRILRLRNEPTLTPPTAELRSLARQFPGALRELDRLPLPIIEARLAAVQRALLHGAEPEVWMRVHASYHGYMRATLRIKRWSRSWPSDSEAALRALAERYVPAADEPDLAHFDASLLAAVRKPPTGRLNPLVLTAVARLHDMEVKEVADLLGLSP